MKAYNTVGKDFPFDTDDRVWKIHGGCVRVCIRKQVSKARRDE